MVDVVRERWLQDESFHGLHRSAELAHGVDRVLNGSSSCWASARGAPRQMKGVWSFPIAAEAGQGPHAQRG